MPMEISGITPNIVLDGSQQLENLQGRILRIFLRQSYAFLQIYIFFPNAGNWRFDCKINFLATHDYIVYILIFVMSHQCIFLVNLYFLPRSDVVVTIYCILVRHLGAVLTYCCILHYFHYILIFPHKRSRECVCKFTFTVTCLLDFVLSAKSH